MNDTPDVDLDVADHDAAAAVLQPYAVPASLIEGGKQVRHNVGVYLQRIPINPLNGLAVFPTKYAQDLGYYKVDILTNRVYKTIASMDELRCLVQTPIIWSWFEHVQFVRSLVQFGNEAELVARYKPRSVLDLACLVALIRPGKRYLIGEPWSVINKKIWQKEPPERGAMFKKSHSLAYSLLVGVDARLKAPEYFATLASVKPAQCVFSAPA